MVGHGGSSAGSYLADPTSPIPSHCASIVVTSTVRVKQCVIAYVVCLFIQRDLYKSYTTLMLIQHEYSCVPILH